jgi:hypothetical protein
MKKRDPFANRHRRDQAIDEPPDGRALAPATPVEPGSGGEIAGHAVDHAGATEQPAELVELTIVPRTREHLHEDRLGDRDVIVQQAIDLVAHWRACASEELDPGRAVDEDHGWVTRDSRI